MGLRKLMKNTQLHKMQEAFLLHLLLVLQLADIPQRPCWRGAFLGWRRAGVSEDDRGRTEAVPSVCVWSGFYNPEVRDFCLPPVAGEKVGWNVSVFCPVWHGDKLSHSLIKHTADSLGLSCMVSLFTNGQGSMEASRECVRGRDWGSSTLGRTWCLIRPHSLRAKPVTKILVSAVQKMEAFRYYRPLVLWMVERSYIDHKLLFNIFHIVSKNSFIIYCC